MKMSCFRKRRKTERKDRQETRQKRSERRKHEEVKMKTKGITFRMKRNLISSHLIFNKYFIIVTTNIIMIPWRGNPRTKASLFHLEIILDLQVLEWEWLRETERRKAIKDHLSVSITFMSVYDIGLQTRGSHIHVHKDVYISCRHQTFQGIIDEGKNIFLFLSSWPSRIKRNIIILVLSTPVASTHDKHNALASVSFFTSRQRRQEDVCWLSHPILGMTWKSCSRFRRRNDYHQSICRLLVEKQDWMDHRSSGLETFVACESSRLRDQKLSTSWYQYQSYL